MKMKAEGVREVWNRYKYAMLVGLLGVLLLLWGGSAERTVTESAANPLPDTAALQTQLEEILRDAAGVGEVRVLLTLESTGQQLLAQDTKLEYRGKTAAPEDYSGTSETVVVDGDSGESPIVTERQYPRYRGALVVCQGGDRPEVQLAVTRAVSVLTGLSSDRVAVVKWQ